MPVQTLKPGTPDDEIWTQIGTVSAELDTETIERFKLKKPLEHFARALLKQMGKDQTRDGNPVVGVKIVSIEFQRLLGYSDYDRKKRDSS